MNSENMLFIILASCGFLYYGFGVYTILFNPKLGAKFINFNKTPLAPWTLKNDADTILKILTFFMFFVFSCLMLAAFYINFISAK